MAEDGATVIRNDPPWHAMTREDVYKKLSLNNDIRRTGLTTQQAAERLEKYGYNKLSEKRKVTLLEKIWAQVANVLVGILVFVAIVSAVRAVTDDVVTNSIQVAIIVGVIAMMYFLCVAWLIALSLPD